MLFPFAKIRWVKSVTMDGEYLAYGGEDPTSLAREPRRAGDAFDLHATPEDADSLGDPAVGDLIVLTQHDQVTHLVEVQGERTEPRPKKTIRRGTRDARFSIQRRCVARLMLGFERAPFIERAFGFDPHAAGGEVFEITALPAFERAQQPLWMVQRRIHHAMTSAERMSRVERFRPG